MTMRSRAVDILEALMLRIEKPELIMPLFSPLLGCLRKIQGGLTQSLAEGKAFEARLRTFVAQKMCSKKISLVANGDEETSEGIADLVSSLIGDSKDSKNLVRRGTLLYDLSRSSSAPLRQLSQAVFLSVSRAVLHGDCEDAKQTICTGMGSLITQYFTKKNSKIPTAMIDDFASRFAAFVSSKLLPVLSSASSNGRTPFLRAEACRLISLLLKRYVHYPEDVQLAIKSHVPALMNNVASSIASLSNGESSASNDNGNSDDIKGHTRRDKKDGKSKRIRPAIQCARDIALLPVCASLFTDSTDEKKDDAPTKGKKGKKSDGGSSSKQTHFAALDGLKLVVSQVQGGEVAAQTMKSLLALTGETPTVNTIKNDANRDKNEANGYNAGYTGNKKQKNHTGTMDETLDKAEQRMLAQRAHEDGESTGTGHNNEDSNGSLKKNKKQKKGDKIQTETNKRKSVGLTPWHS